MIAGWGIGWSGSPTTAKLSILVARISADWANAAQSSGVMEWLDTSGDPLAANATEAALAHSGAPYTLTIYDDNDVQIGSAVTGIDPDNHAKAGMIDFEITGLSAGTDYWGWAEINSGSGATQWGRRCKVRIKTTPDSYPFSILNTSCWSQYNTNTWPEASNYGTPVEMAKKVRDVWQPDLICNADDWLYLSGSANVNSSFDWPYAPTYNTGTGEVFAAYTPDNTSLASTGWFEQGYVNMSTDFTGTVPTDDADWLANFQTKHNAKRHCAIFLEPARQIMMHTAPCCSIWGDHEMPKNNWAQDDTQMLTSGYTFADAQDRWTKTAEVYKACADWFFSFWSFISPDSTGTSTPNRFPKSAVDEATATYASTPDVVFSMNLADYPDRWYGYSIANTFIVSPDCITYRSPQEDTSGDLLGAEQITQIETAITAAVAAGATSVHINSPAVFIRGPKNNRDKWLYRSGAATGTGPSEVSGLKTYFENLYDSDNVDTVVMSGDAHFTQMGKHVHSSANMLIDMSVPPFSRPECNEAVRAQSAALGDDITGSAGLFDDLFLRQNRETDAEYDGDQFTTTVYGGVANEVTNEFDRPSGCGFGFSRYLTKNKSRHFMVTAKGYLIGGVVSRVRDV